MILSILSKDMEDSLPEMTADPWVLTRWVGNVNTACGGVVVAGWYLTLRTEWAALVLLMLGCMVMFQTTRHRKGEGKRS